jgi:hypothetical protein
MVHLNEQAPHIGGACLFLIGLRAEVTFRALTVDGDRGVLQPSGWREWRLELALR